MAKKKKPEFIDRILNPQKYPYITNKDGSVSTHEMAAEVDENGNWFVFPTIQYDGKTLRRFKSNKEAMENASKNQSGYQTLTKQNQPKR